MTYSLVNTNNYSASSFRGRWVKIILSSILFLGVLPFDKSALTLFRSASLGSVLSYTLCGATLLLSILYITYKRNFVINKSNKRFFIVGLLILLGYVLSCFTNEINFTRPMSILCFLIYYLFSFFFFDDLDDLVLSIGIALSLLIVYSFILYFRHDIHVMYIASAYETDFKGIALNRNSFAELALFDIVAFSYLLSKKKCVVISILCIILAIYGVFLTKGAASIICCILLIVGLIFNKLLERIIKACSRETIIVDHDANMPNCNYGIWIDIFPLDGLGNDKSLANSVFRAIRFDSCCLTASIWPKFFRNKNRNFFTNISRFVFYVFGRFINKKKTILRIEKKYIYNDFDTSQYCGCMCGNYGVIDKNIFDKTILAEFEGNMYCIMDKYDEYLTILYGDYMKLPPKEKQISHHNFTAYWRE